MITDNEVYKDCISLKKKIDFLCNPKNSNLEKSTFWKEVQSNFNKYVLEFIEKDKRLFRW
jgi:hypothetical protein